MEDRIRRAIESVRFAGTKWNSAACDLANEAERLQGEVDRLNGMLDEERVNRMAADCLAYACAKAIIRGDVRSRSAIDDALLAYLDIGGLDGFATVPEWVEKYESVQQMGKRK